MNYGIGDRILDRFEIRAIKRGGMGNVYLCYDRDANAPIAVKTILPAQLRDQAARANFREEALNWVSLERHYNIVKALFVEEIDNALFIFAEMVVGDERYGSTVAEYLERRYRFDSAETIKWAVQCCDGMAYAGAKFEAMGKRFVHRDIKPSNLMLTSGKVLKITDFGLVASDADDGRYGGTYGYMSPEQFRGEELDARSDIYGFGCVLYEMLTGGRRPYELTEAEIRGMHPAVAGRALQARHSEADPADPSAFMQESEVRDRLSEAVLTCLEKRRERRYPDFARLRAVLNGLYESLTGREITAKGGEELDEDDWYNKGVALGNLGVYGEAAACYEKALRLDPRDSDAWANEGFAFHRMGKLKEARRSYDRALRIDPRSAPAWGNMGALWQDLGKPKKAIDCQERALAIDPSNPGAYYNKGLALISLREEEEAIRSWRRALEINPNFYSAAFCIGVALGKAGEHEEAIGFYDRALSIDRNHADAWFNKGNSYSRLGMPDQALACYDSALEVDPDYAEAWSNKGIVLYQLANQEQTAGRLEKSVELRERAIGYLKRAAALGSAEAEMDLRKIGVI
jgi:eukaryotic-like serine/threonine-protein kinase